MSAKYVMVIDQRRCVGCHTCAIACKSENNMPDGGAYSLNTVITESGITDLPVGDALSIQSNIITDTATYNRTKGPHIEYLTRSCQHCVDAPCVKNCPTNATWQNEDGIVEMDTRLCINCQECINACPYNNMRVSLGVNPQFSVDFVSGGQGIYPSNGQTVKKCTFCSHRLYDDKLPPEDRKPFCIDHCPARTRFFGDINDVNSEVYKVLAKAKAENRTIRSGSEAFPVRQGFDATESKVYFIGHDYQ